MYIYSQLKAMIMLKKVTLFLFFFSFFTSNFAQSSLNDYKYVIVPDKYDFLDQVDQYQLNSLTKFLFNKYGFQALIENEVFPDDLIGNSCLALKSNVIKESGMFKTKLKIEIKNCKGEVLYISRLGESREKMLKVAFNLALREAFKSFETVNYTYQPNQTIIALGNTNEEIKAKEEIKQLKEEIELLKEEKVTPQKVTDVKPMVAVVVPKNKVVEVETVEIAHKETSNILYAQAIHHGFQLVNSEPKVVYKIKNTGLSDVFLVEGKQAILYKTETEWILEYYQNNALKKEILNIKF